MSHFSFRDYSVQELRDCGEAFLAHFSAAPLTSTRQWTASVKRWFFDTTPPDGSVRAFMSGERGEFLFDLCHTTYPHRQGRGAGYHCLAACTA